MSELPGFVCFIFCNELLSFFSTSVRVGMLSNSPRMLYFYFTFFVRVIDNNPILHVHRPVMLSQPNDVLTLVLASKGPPSPAVCAQKCRRKKGQLNSKFVEVPRESGKESGMR